jgi:hypothetical protein
VTAVLVVVGAPLESAGLWLVARDVRDARRESMNLPRGRIVVPVETVEEESRVFPPAVVGGAPPRVPTLEEHVQQLAREVETLRRRLDADAERHVRDHREMTDRFAG